MTRPISSVPKIVLICLGVFICLQVVWHLGLGRPVLEEEKLKLPPPLAFFQATSFGDPIVSAKIVTLYLQSFDRQPGMSIPFRRLDYPIVQQWLGRILDLDPPAQYPLLLASRVYGEVSDKLRQQQMLEFVYQRFQEDPNHRWPWLAHAAVLAKHRLNDLPLAVKYARAIRLHATAHEVPSWAKQMEIFLLEDMNELESAKILLGGLLVNGKITDPHEIQFLEKRLSELNAKGSIK